MTSPAKIKFGKWMPDADRHWLVGFPPAREYRPMASIDPQANPAGTIRAHADVLLLLLEAADFELGGRLSSWLLPIHEWLLRKLIATLYGPLARVHIPVGPCAEYRPCGMTTTVAQYEAMFRARGIGVIVNWHARDNWRDAA